MKWTQPRSWLSKSDLNHSARAAVGTVASLLVASLSGLPEPYWAAVSTMIVMQSALGTSLPIARRRFAGTALGAAFGAVTSTYFGPNIWVFGAGIFALGLICTALGRLHKTLQENLDRSAFRYAGITLAIIMLVPRTNAPWIIALHRFLEVSIGILVGLVMAVVWPDRFAETKNRS